MYTLKKDGAFWCAVTINGGRVQFRSLNRGRVRGWIAENTSEASA